VHRIPHALNVGDQVDWAIVPVASLRIRKSGRFRKSKRVGIVKYEEHFTRT
jgi:hypothetical protein